MLHRVKIGLLALLFSSLAHAATIELTQLPLNSAASTTVSDIFPMVNVNGNVTMKMTLWDLVNLPPFVSTYAPIASPVLTGRVTDNPTGPGAEGFFISRSGSGSTNGDAWQFQVVNSVNSDAASLGETSSTYTTGGTLASWLGNSNTFIYYPTANPLFIGTGTGSTGAAISFDASANTKIYNSLTAKGSFTQGSSGQLTEDASGNFSTSGTASITGTTTIGKAGSGSSGIEIIQSGSGGASMIEKFINNTSSGFYNWEAGAQILNNNAFQLIPSTATDGSTYSYSVFSDTYQGVLTLNTIGVGSKMVLQAETTGGAGSDYGSQIQMIPSNASTNWEISENVRGGSGELDITPSTAGGGSTFSTPAFKISSGGVVTLPIAGSVLAGNTTINYDSSSGSNLFFNRSANTVANAAFWQTGSTPEWSFREPTGASNFAIRDVVNGVDKIAITQGGGVSFPETITSTGDFLVGGANGTDTHVAQIYNRGSTLGVLAANGSTGTITLAGGNTNGILIVDDQNTGHMGMFSLAISGSTIAIVSDAASIFSVAAPSADGKIHVQFSGGVVTFTNETGTALIISSIYLKAS